MTRHCMRHLVAILLPLLGLVRPSVALAQAPRASCAYTECALRMEGSQLIRGRDVVVGRTSLTGMPRLARLVAAQDSAQAYAQTFDRLYPRSRWLMVTSGLLGGLALGIAMDRVDAPERGFVIGLGASSLLLGGTSWYLDRRATRALGSALYWHNASLPRDEGR